MSKINQTNDPQVFLVDELIESLESDIEREAKQRRDEVRNHIVEPISGEVALAQIRKILQK